MKDNVQRALVWLIIAAMLALAAIQRCLVC